MFSNQLYKFIYPRFSTPLKSPMALFKMIDPLSHSYPQVIKWLIHKVIHIYLSNEHKRKKVIPEVIHSPFP